MKIDKLQKLIDSGIPLYEATFHQASKNADGVPENSFNIFSDKPTRRVKMWQMNNGDILCNQKQTHTKKEIYWFVGGSNKIEARILLEELNDK